MLRARLKTIGVVEHAFMVKGGGASGSKESVEWRIYDVGGARHQRQAWAPYFDDGVFPSPARFSLLDDPDHSECNNFSCSHLRI